MEQMVVTIIGGQNENDHMFSFIMDLMGYRNQFLMNHWQTTSYAEHKLTDSIVGDLDGFIDRLGENVIGTFGRPKINTVSSDICDIAVCSTLHVLNCIDKGIKDVMNDCKEECSEGLLSILGELDEAVKKFKYLATLS